MRKTQKKPSVVIRMGASNNEVIVNGITFHKNGMTRAEKAQMARMTVAALKRSGFFKPVQTAVAA